MHEEIILKADRLVLPGIALVIDRFGRAAGLDHSALNDVQVAVAEACTNAIVHGLSEDRGRTFSLELRAEEELLTVTVREDGEPFDLEDVAPADLASPLPERRIGGLGIYLIHNLMDSVEFLTGSDGMKVLRMTKRGGGGGV